MLGSPGIDNMAWEFQVSSIDEYDDVCRQISASGRTFYRGQMTDYPQVLPSLFRPTAIPTFAFEKMIVELFVSAYGVGDPDEYGEGYDKQFEDSFPEPIRFPNFFPSDAQMGFDIKKAGPGTIFGQPWFNYVPEDALLLLQASLKEHWSDHSDALLQHYGVPSRGLDITTDRFAALWFATNAFTPRTDGTALYVPASGPARVVYAFQDLPSRDIVDLQSVTSFAEVGYPELKDIPNYGQRGINQRGLLLFGASPQFPDLRKLVVASIHILPGDWPDDYLRKGDYTYRNLIPLADADSFYGALLEEKKNPTSRYKDMVKYIVEYV
jgi:hypothetical protein